MTDPALGALLGGGHPDFRLEPLGSGYTFDAFTMIRRSDGEKVGQVRYFDRRALVIRYDNDSNNEIESPHPFFCGDDEHGNEFYAPAWETLADFVASLEKHPFKPGRW